MKEVCRGRLEKRLKTDRGDETVDVCADFGVDDLDISPYGGNVEVHCDRYFR